MHTRWLALCSVLVIGGVPQSSAIAQGYPAATALRGSLSFDAKATLGAFTGTTTTLKGEMSSTDGLARVRGWVEAPAKTLSSQNGKRDRDTWSSLEVEKYPALRFQLDSVAPGELHGDSTSVVLMGHFTLHGQTRSARLPGWVWRQGSIIRFKGATPVNVKDYGIGGLTKALGMLRMNENIIVRVDVTFGTGGTS
ncbi:MAG: YceI family protein [Gemmatimonadota bacterium]